MVLRKENEEREMLKPKSERKEDEVQLKELEFEPVLNVQKEVNVMNSNSWYGLAFIPSIESVDFMISISFIWTISSALWH